MSLLFSSSLHMEIKLCLDRSFPHASIKYILSTWEAIWHSGKKKVQISYLQFANHKLATLFNLSEQSPHL